MSKRGKNEFSSKVAEEIRRILKLLREPTVFRDQQKIYRNQLRRINFYIEDFRDDKSRGFTAEDFDYLVRIGRIKIY